MTLTAATLIVLLVFVGWTWWRAARTYLRFRGKRIVTCPETQQPAAVDLAAWRVAVGAACGKPVLRLGDCSRWREVEPCSQACLAGIEAAPEDCRVLAIVSKWYAGKTCTCCGAPVGQISPWRHKPCLMSPGMRIFQWQDIPAETIPAVLGTYAPVCWRCLVAETHIS